jgi:hypothetical protein
MKKIVSVISVIEKNKQKKSNVKKNTQNCNDFPYLQTRKPIYFTTFIDLMIVR